MKKLGILGGMGPYATIDFIKHIYDLTPGVTKESDHIHILTDINISIPSRTRSVLYNEDSPVDGMIEAINGLEKMGADVISVPCNSAHYFYDDVTSAIRIPWLNMIEEVKIFLGKMDIKSATILGGFVTVNKQIYKDDEIDFYYLNDSDNEFIYEIIEHIKSQNHDLIDLSKLREVISVIKSEAIILACTELTEIIDDINQPGYLFIDTNMVYAMSIISKIKDV